MAEQQREYGKTARHLCSPSVVTIDAPYRVARARYKPGESAWLIQRPIAVRSGQAECRLRGPTAPFPRCPRGVRSSPQRRKSGHAGTAVWGHKEPSLCTTFPSASGPGPDVADDQPSSARRVQRRPPPVDAGARLQLHPPANKASDNRRARTTAVGWPNWRIVSVLVGYKGRLVSEESGGRMMITLSAIDCVALAAADHRQRTCAAGGQRSRTR